MSDLDLWPRIRQAIYATAIDRCAVEENWPECHRRNCRGHHPSPDEAFRHIINKVSETVYGELAHKFITEPDEGNDR